MDVTDLLILIFKTFFNFILSYVGFLLLDHSPFLVGSLNAFIRVFVSFPNTLSIDPAYPPFSHLTHSKFVPYGFIQFDTDFFP